MSISEICKVVNGSRKALSDSEGKPLVRAVMEDSVLKSMHNKGPANFGSDGDDTEYEKNSASRRRDERRKRRAMSTSTRKMAKKQKMRKSKKGNDESREILKLKV